MSKLPIGGVITFDNFPCKEAGEKPTFTLDIKPRLPCQKRLNEFRP